MNPGNSAKEMFTNAAGTCNCCMLQALVGGIIQVRIACISCSQLSS
jgi:hypothetical protein